eukprot:CAMPEP_0197525072 /NCGR_PEP_ID=MMETSP1318-20131121/10599_1 /TAXON_ID=552666 /ORGANISM="Partenskyella glossopodia, Strain RCC365" /LENGTH=231 /DNA_ID=CAMNT_0043078233 /DNA_START=64 /DNA_END=759 /DNA_ORIENTATION=-
MENMCSMMLKAARALKPSSSYEEEFEEYKEAGSEWSYSPKSKKRGSRMRQNPFGLKLEIPDGEKAKLAKEASLRPTNQGKKKRRRRSNELREEERWTCPSGCGKYFRKTSTISIQKHTRECQSLKLRREKDLELMMKIKAVKNNASPMSHYKLTTPDNQNQNQLMMDAPPAGKSLFGRKKFKLSSRSRMKRHIKYAINNCPKICKRNPYKKVHPFPSYDLWNAAAAAAIHV